MPDETEAVLAGEQPAEGYPGGAHRDDALGDGTYNWPPAPSRNHRIDRPLMPQKTPARRAEQVLTKFGGLSYFRWSKTRVVYDGHNFYVGRRL